MGIIRPSTLTLQGKEIEVTYCDLRQATLKFYEENPRIYSFIYKNEEFVSQEQIEDRLSDLDHVKQLVQSIKANGGLIDPLIVRQGDNVVLEGNSRLAAYRILAKTDPIKWGKVKCCLLPSDIDKRLIFALLGEYHIIGRKDWAPYEQAGYLWRRCHKQGTLPEEIARDMGLSVREIKHLVEVYSFMVQQEDQDVSRWSYYDEYLKSRKIKEARSKFPEIDKTVVAQIKAGQIPKADDIRKKLAKIVTDDKLTKTFSEKKGSLDRCFEKYLRKGANNHLYKILNKFRTTILDPEIKSELLEMPEDHLKRCKFELDKIWTGIHRLLKKIE
jgi:DNA-binding transcriptional MerR regulator